MIRWLVVVLGAGLGACAMTPMPYLLPPESPPLVRRFVAADAVPVSAPSPRLFSIRANSQDGPVVNGAVCFAPTEFRIPEGPSTLMAWRRQSRWRFEFEALAVPTLDESAADVALRATERPDGTVQALVPCDLDVVWVRPLLAGLGIQLDIAVTIASGLGQPPVLHLRVSGTADWAGYFDRVMKSRTGLLFQVGYRLRGHEDVEVAPLLLRVPDRDVGENAQPVDDTGVLARANMRSSSRFTSPPGADLRSFQEGGPRRLASAWRR